MMKMIKKIAAITLSALIISGCFSAAGFAAEAQEEIAVNPGILTEQLKDLDGVVSVTPVEVSELYQQQNRFQGRYIIEFEQPIDWKNPDSGTFTQRVFLGYSDTADVTCYHASGYCISDVMAPDYLEVVDASADFTNRYDVNYVELEYRFFASSSPDGISLDNEQYWEYMTSENASKDFHHIITELGKVLDGSTIFYGESKGGYTTENMAYYYPDDIDAYVSYVAPLTDGINDTRLYDAVYTEIGNKDPRYGEENAAYCRDIIKELQLFLLSENFRSIVQPALTGFMAQAGLGISPLVTEDEAYEAAVVEFGVQIWQYLQNFDYYAAMLAMPEETEEESADKMNTIATAFLNSQTLMGISNTTVLSPYYIQCYLEMGALQINLSYLREAGAEIRTLPENEADLLTRLWCPLAVNGNLKYNAEHRNEIINFLNTTEKDIIKIVGLSDVWYFEKAPTTENEHVHYFEVPGSHSACIETMDEADKAQCYEILDSLLNK